jgi:septal ring factor EnvC (AmiA/AmiB activator)
MPPKLRRNKGFSPVLAASLAGLLLAFAALGGGALADQDAEDKLRQVERELQRRRDHRKDLEREARRLKGDITSMRRSLIGAAATVQRFEDLVSSVEAQLTALSAEERRKSEDLASRRSELTETLGTLARLTRQPPEALIASPGSPLQSIRGSMVLSAVIPILRARADSLSAELASLHNLRTEIGAKRARLATANDDLRKERRALDRLLKRTGRRRAITLQESAKEKRRMARLAAEAKDLRTLMRNLEEEAQRQARLGGDDGRLQPPTSSPFSAQRGRLPLPARGRIVLRYGQRNQVGLKSKGLTISTRPGAPVVAPYDGRIVYAGPFRSYGMLLIIRHGEGYHTLIAGMSRVDGIVGQWLLAGEPIGQMSEKGLGGGKNTSPGKGIMSPTLYLELRHNSEPINPERWLAASDRKVSG